MSDEEGFLAALDENRDDDTSRLVYADWLEDRGDERAEYLRAEHELAQLPGRIAALRARLAELSARIDPAWRSRVSRRRRVVFLGCAVQFKIHAIKVVREITGGGLAEAKNFVEGPPRVLGEGLTPEEADALAARFAGIASVSVEPFAG